MQAPDFGLCGVRIQSPNEKLSWLLMGCWGVSGVCASRLNSTAIDVAIATGAATEKMISSVR